MKFKFLNIPVYIHPTFWIFLLFFTNIYEDFSFLNVIVGAVVFLSLLVHEYGHALTALYFGARPTITLEGFGGNAQYNGSGITPKQDFLITLNGPLLQSFLIALSYYLLNSAIFENYYINYLFYITMRMNVMLVLLNLIPIVPLDGGQLLRNILERKFGVAGYRISVLVGIGSAAVAAPVLFFYGYFFFGILLVIFGFQNMQVFRQIKKASGENHHFSRYNQALEKIKENDLDQAREILRKLLKVKDGLIKKLAVESLAKIYVQQGANQRSYDLLMNTDHEGLGEGKCLLCKLAFERQNYELVARYSMEIYAIEPTYETALLNAKAFAHLSKPNLAGGWLKTATLFGSEYKKQAKEALGRQSFDSVRNDEIFEEHVDKIFKVE